MRAALYIAVVASIDFPLRALQCSYAQWNSGAVPTQMIVCLAPAIHSLYLSSRFIDRQVYTQVLSAPYSPESTTAGYSRVVRNTYGKRGGGHSERNRVNNACVVALCMYVCGVRALSICPTRCSCLYQHIAVSSRLDCSCINIHV